MDIPRVNTNMTEHISSTSLSFPSPNIKRERQRYNPKTENKKRNSLLFFFLFFRLVRLDFVGGHRN